MNPTPTSRTVLILGANGRLGAAAARAFDAAGWRVLAQVRRAASPELPPRASVLLRPLADVDALVAAARPADVVLHAVNPPLPRWQREALPALQHGLDLAERLHAHFMLPGNVYNHGTSMPALLDEHAPFRPDTSSGALRVQMEALIAERARTGGFTASVVRAGDFYGAGRGTWFDRAIVPSLAAGRLVYPGPLDVPHAWAYLPDLAAAFVRVASVPRPASFDTWHFEGHTLTGAQLLDAIVEAAEGLGVRPSGGWRRRGLPWPLLRLGGIVVPSWRELTRMSYLWRTPHALDGRRLGALPGKPQPTPLPTALRQALAALGVGAPRLAHPQRATAGRRWFASPSRSSCSSDPASRRSRPAR